MAEQEQDRNEKATPYKLEKARERGQVARSPEVTAAAVFTAAMLFLTWQGWETWRSLFEFDQALLRQAALVDASPAGLWSLVRRTVTSTMGLAAPFLATLVFVAVAGNVLQTGAVLSVEPIKADWSRINPATGLKRLMTIRTLFVAARSLLKLVLLGWVAYLALRSFVPHFFAVARLPPLALVRTLLADLGSLGLRIALVLGLIAILDLVFTRREFAKQMRMSRRELKEEVKHREGDPRIRARLRDLRREMLKRSLSVRRTRDADVLITNPTHVAVALRYVHGEMASPRLVAKGAGQLAAAMRKIAARHRIPVVQNPSLARRIFRELQVDHGVPPELYAQVARIIVWVFAMRDAARATTGRPAASSGGAA